MAKEDFCCYCEEETGYNEGRTIYTTFDGLYAHKWCTELYDKKHKPRKLQLEEEKQRLQGKLAAYEREIHQKIKRIEKEIQSINEMEKST